jgi:hypothetical protein
MDEVIEEIRELMFRSTEAVNKGKLNNKEPATAIGREKQKQQ